MKDVNLTKYVHCIVDRNLTVEGARLAMNLSPLQFYLFLVKCDIGYAKDYLPKDILPYTFHTCKKVKWYPNVGGQDSQIKTDII